MENITLKRKAVIDAYAKGYRVIDNRVEYKGKTRKLDIRHKKSGIGISQYATFGVRDYDGKRTQILVHHLVAYQKYKDFFINAKNKYEQDLVVMHMDNNTLNNTEKNIYLGTRGDVYENRINPSKFHSRKYIPMNNNDI
jgi:hypothetical protein